MWYVYRITKVDTKELLYLKSSPEEKEMFFPDAMYFINKRDNTTLTETDVLFETVYDFEDEYSAREFLSNDLYIKPEIPESIKDNFGKEETISGTLGKIMLYSRDWSHVAKVKLTVDVRPMLVINGILAFNFINSAFEGDDVEVTGYYAHHSASDKYGSRYMELQFIVNSFKVLK